MKQEHSGIYWSNIFYNVGSMKPDLNLYAAAIDSNTCALYACAPQYPHGIVDPIQVAGDNI